MLMVLADFHNEHTGLLFPAASTVGILACCNEKTVRRHLKALQADGFLWVKPRPGTSPEIEFNWNRPTPDTVGMVVEGWTAKDQLTPDKMTGPVMWTAADIDRLRAAENSKQTPGQNDRSETDPGQNDRTHPGQNDPSPDNNAPTPVKMSDDPSNNNNNIKRYSITPGWFPSDATLAQCPKMGSVQVATLVNSFRDYWTDAEQAPKNKKPADVWVDLFVLHCQKNTKFRKSIDDTTRPLLDTTNPEMTEKEKTSQAANDKRLQALLVKAGQPNPFDKTGTE